MNNYFVWLTPSLSWQASAPDDVPPPISSHLHFIAANVDRETLAVMRDRLIFIMTEEQVEMYLRHDAEGWAWMKTGDDHRPMYFDHGYYATLMAAYKKQLAKTGKLDFTKPCAGINI